MPLSNEAYDGGVQNNIIIDFTTPFLPIEFFVKAKIRNGGDSLVLKVSAEAITHPSSPRYTTFPLGLGAEQNVAISDTDASALTRFTVPTIAPPASFPESECYLPGSS
jgi:hypothetical protein